MSPFSSLLQFVALLTSARRREKAPRPPPPKTTRVTSLDTFAPPRNLRRSIRRHREQTHR
jgi:hypothetical protein